MAESSNPNFNSFQFHPQSVPPPGVPYFPHPGMTRFASPYAALVRPPFPPRPLGAVGVVPQLSRHPGLVRAPIVPAGVRPPPIVSPIAKPQTIVYVGKIASRVDNNFMLSLLQLCGPVKSWKRYQDPSTGTWKSFGFCEFESAEGVLRALRLLSTLNIDGQELMVKVDQATRAHLDLYVEKKMKIDQILKETETKEAVKVEASQVVADGNELKASNETKLDGCDSQDNHEPASFGHGTDEDRTGDREVLDKITVILEERMKNMPLPPPPPLTSLNPANSESQREGESNVDAKGKAKDRDETSDHKPPSEHERTEQSSPDDSRKDERRSTDHERDLKREKERELERIERERVQERSKREKERDYKIRENERKYKVREKDWEAREKDKEHYRKREREREKERAQERKWEIVDQERESHDGYKKSRKHRSSDEQKRRRREEKEEDLADKSREDEEITETKRKAEEESQRTLQLEALKALSQHADNEIAKPLAPDGNYIAIVETHIGQTSDHDEDIVGQGIIQNGAADEFEGNLNSDAPLRKLGFGLSCSGKRTAVPSVFDEDEEEDKKRDTKMRPLVPLDYSTEEPQVVQPPTSEAPLSNLAAASEFAKHISNVNSKEEMPSLDRERSRRKYDRSSHRDRHDPESRNARDEGAKESFGRDKIKDHGTDKVKIAESKKLLDAKQLIDMIPKTKEELFSYKINWDIYEEEAVKFIIQNNNKNNKRYSVVFNYKMAEALIGKFSETVEKESQQVQENASEAVSNVAESAEGVADERKEEVEEKVVETKKSIASLVSQGLSKAEGLVHPARDFADQKGPDLQGKIEQSFASLAKMVPGGSGEKKSQETDPANATDRDLPENQPLLRGTGGTQTSWTNCWGLFDCLTSSDR